MLIPKEKVLNLNIQCHMLLKQLPLQNRKEEKVITLAMVNKYLLIPDELQ